MHDKRATEPLLALLKDRTVMVRQRAVVVLGRIKDLQALPALLDVLWQGQHESYEASKAIQKFGKKAVPKILKAFEQSKKQELLLMLVELKYGGAFELILKLLESKEHTSRLVGIRELGKLGDKRAISALQKLLGFRNQSDM